MPAITRQIQNMVQEGPTLKVIFTIPLELEKKLIAEGKQLPKPITILAMVDTGASNCVLQEDIPKQLGLNPVNKIKMKTPSCHDYDCYQYAIRMIIPEQNFFYEGLFTTASLKDQEIKGLIGRDLLMHGTLIYIGYMNQFTFAI